MRKIAFSKILKFQDDFLFSIQMQSSKSQEKSRQFEVNLKLIFSGLLFGIIVDDKYLIHILIIFMGKAFLIRTSDIIIQNISPSYLDSNLQGTIIDFSCYFIQLLILKSIYIILLYKKQTPKSLSFSMKTLLSKTFSQKNDILQSNLENINLCRQNSKCKTKKMFSRKPQTVTKTNQNISKLVSIKAKSKNQTVLPEGEQYQSETRLKKLLNQSMNLKFVSSKNSKSLQKLFMSQSMQQLTNSKIQMQNQKKCLPQYINNCKNNKNRSFTSKNLKLNLKLNQNPLQTIIDSEDYYVEKGFKKRAISYYTEKDDETNCHETTQESPRGTQSGVFDFSSSDIMFSRVCEKECLECLNLKDQIKILSQKNNNLQNILENKQKQIYQLQAKIQSLETVNRRIQDEKIKIQQQIKEKQLSLINQKDNIEKQLKCIKNTYNKTIQDLKYKQIQNNINKRYRKQYADLSIKVKDLEDKLQQYKAKAKFYKEKTNKCQKCQYLKRNGSHPVLNLNLKQGKRLSLKKEQKKQRGSHLINKRYSQDTVFSLSLTSEQED